MVQIGNFFSKVYYCHVISIISISLWLKPSLLLSCLAIVVYGSSIENKQRYLCRKVKRPMTYWRIILRRSCSILLILKLLCQFNIKLPSMSWGKILSRTVRSKYSMLVWQEILCTLSRQWKPYFTFNKYGPNLHEVSHLRKFANTYEFKNLHRTCKSHFMPILSHN